MFGFGLSNSKILPRLGEFTPYALPGLIFYADMSDTTHVNSLLAANFVAANTEKLTSSSSDFNKTTTSFTFGAWVRWDSLGAGTGIIGKWGNATNERSYLLYKNSSNVVDFRLSTDGSGQTLLNTFTASAGTWYFIVCVYDADNDIMKLSKDGEDFYAQSYASDLFASSIDLQMGGLPVGNDFDGRIDASFFYDKALSLAEIQSLYNTGNGRNFANLSTINGTEYAIAQDFDSASSQYLSSSSTDFNVGDENFSLGCWVKFDASAIGTATGVLGKYDTGNRSFLILKSGTDRMQMNISNDGTTIQSATENSIAITSGVWYFVWGQYSSTSNQMTIGVNTAGTLANPVNGAYAASTSDFWVGRFDAVYSDIQVQEAFFYNNAIGATKAASLYNSGNGVNYSDLGATQLTDLVSWYPMNNVAGENELDAHGTNDLTSNGSPVSTAGKVNNTTIVAIESDLTSWWTLNEPSGTRYDAYGANDLTDVNTVGAAVGHIQEDVVNSGDSVYTVIDKIPIASNMTQPTVVNQPTWEGGNSLLCSSVAYMTIDYANSLRFIVGQSTSFSTWIKASGAGQKVILCNLTSDAWQGFCLQLNASGFLNFDMRNTTPNYFGKTGTVDLRDGNWHQVGVTYNGSADNTGVKLYVDGVEITTTTPKNDTIAAYSGSDPSDLGRLGDTPVYFDGSFGDAIITSTVLTDDHMDDLYNYGLSEYP